MTPHPHPTCPALFSVSRSREWLSTVVGRLIAGRFQRGEYQRGVRPTSSFSCLLFLPGLLLLLLMPRRLTVLLVLLVLRLHRLDLRPLTLGRPGPDTGTYSLPSVLS